MRFAGSPGALDAMGIYSGYDPGGIGDESMFGRSRQRSMAMDADAALRGTELMNEAKLEATEITGQSKVDQVPGIGQQALTGFIKGAVGGLPGMIGGGGAALSPVEKLAQPLPSFGSPDFSPANFGHSSGALTNVGFP